MKRLKYKLYVHVYCEKSELLQGVFLRTICIITISYLSFSKKEYSCSIKKKEKCDFTLEKGTEGQKDIHLETNQKEKHSYFFSY